MTAYPSVRWVVYEPGDDFTFRWGYLDGDVVAEWDGLLTLRATREGELKAMHPAPEAAPLLVEKTRLGVATAFLRSRRRQHSLHASAVSFEKRALVCVGASGVGKSTMAEIACRRQGVGLLADDIAAIDIGPGGAAHVSPSERSVWLATETSNEKVPRALAPSPGPIALSSIVVLVFDEAFPAVEVRPIRGGDAVSAILPSVVRFERTSALWEREIDFLARLVSQARIFEVRRSHDIAAETVVASLLRLLEGDKR